MAVFITKQDSRLLFRALRANAVFSLASGLLLSAAPSALAAWIGFPYDGWLRLIGVGLVGFGAYLWLLSGRQRIARRDALWISAMDLLWVAGTGAAALGIPGLFNATGVAVVLWIAVVVLLFFDLQTWALWRAGRQARAAA